MILVLLNNGKLIHSGIIKKQYLSFHWYGLLDQPFVQIKVDYYMMVGLGERFQNYHI